MDFDGRSDVRGDQDDQLTPTEERIALIWQQELGAERIGPHSDFFRLGGDSLKMLTVLFQVSELVGFEVSPGLIFEGPTLREFCRNLDVDVERERSSAPADASPGELL